MLTNQTLFDTMDADSPAFKIIQHTLFSPLFTLHTYTPIANYPDISIFDNFFIRADFPFIPNYAADFSQL